MAQTLKRKRDRPAPGTGARNEKRAHTGPKHNRVEPPVADAAPSANDDEDDVMGDFEDLEAGEAEGRRGAEDEEEEWGGVNFGDDGEGNGEDEEAETSAAPDTVSGKGNGKVPARAEELKDIKDATDLFKSGSFKMQIDALLPNVRPKAHRIPPLERFLHALHGFLSALPSYPLTHPLRAAETLLSPAPSPFLAGKKGKGKGKQVAQSAAPVVTPYPLPYPTEEANWKVAFEAPADIAIVGSWANSLSVKGPDGARFVVDVAVEMPSTLFQEKDRLNGRFFHKRAFYLAFVAAALAQSQDPSLSVDLLYENACDDPRLVTLVLRPRSNDTATDFSKLNAEVRIIPTVAASCPIPIRRLSPGQSNLRVTSSSSAAAGDAPEATATPLYNTALLVASSPRAHLLAVHATKQAVPAFADALALLRIWANQRGYGGGAGSGLADCVRGFAGRGMWWSALLQLLVNGEEPRQKGKAGKSQKRKPLGRGLSSYQLFKATLDFLANHEFASQPAFVKSEYGHKFDPEEYAALHEATFVDSTSTINLLAGVPLGSLDLLRLDAKTTLEALDRTSSSENIFREVFLKDHRQPFSRFDVVLRIDLSLAKFSSSVYATLDSGSSGGALISRLCSYLRRGLGNRAKAVALLHPVTALGQISQRLEQGMDTLLVGLVLDTEHAFRLVDHGPVAGEENHAVASEFRDFWGDKAELRRFKDGQISESVVWEVKNSDERTHIPAMIVRHVLQRHFGVDAVSHATSWQPGFDSVLRMPDDIGALFKNSAVGVGFKSALAAFDGLVKVLKGLDEELPLGVLNISPVSSSLRYTSVFSPVPIPLRWEGTSELPQCARYLPAIPFNIEFEKSARWPDDLAAIQKMKLAFFERLAAAIGSAINGARARVVIGHGVSTIQDQGALEVVLPDGWAFSARIWHDREGVLLDRILDDQSHIVKREKTDADAGKARERHQAAEAMEVHLRRFLHAPQHHRAIAALCHRCPAYAGTARLVKRWFASHWLLDTHVSEEAVEILCAQVFLPVSSADIPGSKELGFTRVLSWLAEWTWEEGVTVDLFESGVDLASLGPAGVQSQRRRSKPRAWRIATAMDVSGGVWTSAGPDSVVARRIRLLAQATAAHLQQMSSSDADVKTIFLHPTDDYDVIVEFDRSSLPRYFQNVAADETAWTRPVKKFANMQASSANSPLMLRPDFDPARLFVNDVQRVYQDTLKVFFDAMGGDRFGLVWEPSLLESRPFRVFGGFSSVPLSKSKDKEKDRVVLNKAGILSELERLGAGLITQIIVRE